jgi:putative DNA primase/helicase
MDIGLTAPQNKAGLIEWALKCELDSLSDMGTKSLGAAMREAAAGKTVVVVDLPGYHRITAGGVPLAAYAWAGRVYFLGCTPDFKVYVTGAAADAIPSEGDWKTGIKAIQPIAKKNPRLLVSLCVSLSAALLRAFGMPSFTLALWAPTSKGKSTFQLVCSAMTGLPKILQWNGTAIGIQEVFADSPDQPRCLDDMHKAAKFEDVAQLVMATGNGSARLISKRASGSNPPRELHSSPIVSTEKALASMVGSTAAAGMFARYFEIGQGLYGMFDNLCGHPNGAALSQHLKSLARAQYGTVWPRWLKLLSSSWPKVEALHKEEFPELRAAILKSASNPELDDITNRVVDNLAFAAFAGVLATELGLWTISARRVSSAFGLLLKEHLDRTPTGNALAARIVEALAGYIETHGDKFPSMTAANDPDRAGHVGYLIEDDKHGTLYLFIPAIFRTLFIKQFGEEVYEALRAAGYLVCHGSRHNRFTKRVPAGPDGEKKPMDFIAIKASIRYTPSRK